MVDLFQFANCFSRVPEGKNPWFTPTPGDLQSAVNAAVAASLPQKRLSTDARGHVQLEKVRSGKPQPIFEYVEWKFQ